MIGSAASVPAAGIRGMARRPRATGIGRHRSHGNEARGSDLGASSKVGRSARMTSSRPPPPPITRYAITSHRPRTRIIKTSELTHFRNNARHICPGPDRLRSPSAGPLGKPVEVAQVKSHAQRSPRSPVRGIPKATADGLGRSVGRPARAEQEENSSQTSATAATPCLACAPGGQRHRGALSASSCLRPSAL